MWLAPLLFLTLFSNFEEDPEEVIEGKESFAEIEELIELKQTPIDINKADKFELQKIPWINKTLAEKIIKKRNNVGSFKTLSHFKKTTKISRTLFEKIHPYIKIYNGRIGVPPVKRKPLDVKFYTRMIEKIEEKHKFGDPIKQYNSLKMNYRRYFLSLLTEKDYFEKSYADFWRVYGEIKFDKFIDKLSVGHYELEFAQGLIFSSPWSIMKLSKSFSGHNRGIRPYRSAGNENHSLCGIAIESFIKKIQCFLFFSKEPRDRTSEASPDSLLFATKYDYLYHSDENKLARKDKIKETLYGARIRYKGIGTTGYRSYRNWQNIEDSPLSLMGIDYETSLFNLNVFSEIAFSFYEDIKGSGKIIGLYYKKKPVIFTSLLRDYSPSFLSPLGMGFCDNRKNRNEKGYFNKIDYRPVKNINISAYFDIITHGKIDSDDNCSYKQEARIQLRYRLFSDLIFTLQYKHKGERQGIRFQYDTKASNLSIRLRYDQSFYKEAGPPGKGITSREELIYVDAKYEPFNRLTIQGRYIIFDGETSIYEYEPDLYGLLTNIHLSETGIRYFILLRNKITKHIKLEIKYSRQEKKDQDAVSKYGIQISYR